MPKDHTKSSIGFCSSCQNQRRGIGEDFHPDPIQLGENRFKKIKHKNASTIIIQMSCDTIQIPAKAKTGTVQKWFTKMPPLASSNWQESGQSHSSRKMQPFLNIMNLMQLRTKPLTYLLPRVERAGRCKAAATSIILGLRSRQQGHLNIYIIPTKCAHKKMQEE